MKHRFSSLFFPTALCLGLAVVPVRAQNPDLQIQLAGEEPTGVFFDRDTLAPQTPVLFTARIDNTTGQSHDVEVTWRVLGSLGEQVWKSSDTFTIGASDSIVRRQLFDPPARGGYLLQVTARMRKKGPDFVAESDWPFAVTIAPLPNTVAAARPQSFFVLTTPTRLSGNDLDFYSRIGARVLRSTLPENPAAPDWTAVESQLNERQKRNLASIAWLPVTEAGPHSSETYFSRQVPATLAKFGGLTTWELSGDISAADLDGWSQVARTRRSDLLLLGPIPTANPAVKGVASGDWAHAVDGVTFDWPVSGAHPVALRRLWLSRAAGVRAAGVAAFHLRREDDLGLSEPTPAAAASQLTADFLAAIESGASSMSEVLPPPGAPAPSFQGKPLVAGGASAMAQGAAFDMMTRTLEDASFREILFPRSPALDGALFRAQHGAIAVLYATSGSGKLSVHLAPARAYDVFGNPVGEQKGDTFTVPLSGQPVYLVTDQAADVLGFALRDGKLDGINPLQAQVLPLSRETGIVSPTSTYVRVRLQNIGLGQRSGRISLEVPRGWKLADRRFDYHLAEGESKTYEFRVSQSRAETGLVPFKVDATSGGSHYSWTQNVPVVSALNISPGHELTIDGDLADWAGSDWMQAGPNADHISARVALRYDQNNLYIAAQVQEPGLAARRVDEANYDFWRDHDALQFAFGTSDNSGAVPGPEPFADSDRGFLLSPFHQHGANDFDGRVLSLWSPEKPYGTVADHVRWGGMVPGSQCIIRRDERTGTTVYEARIPLSAIPELDPAGRASKDSVVRFGWLLHHPEGAPLDWGKLVGNFPWWDNTKTFLPAGVLTSALRSTLGFTRIGEVTTGPVLGVALAAPGPAGLPEPGPALDEGAVVPAQPMVVAPAAPRALPGVSAVGPAQLPPPPVPAPVQPATSGPLPGPAAPPVAGPGSDGSGPPPAGVAPLPKPLRRIRPQIPPYAIPPSENGAVNPPPLSSMG